MFVKRGIYWARSCGLTFPLSSLARNELQGGSVLASVVDCTGRACVVTCSWKFDANSFPVLRCHEAFHFSGIVFISQPSLCCLSPVLFFGYKGLVQHVEH